MNLSFFQDSSWQLQTSKSNNLSYHQKKHVSRILTATSSKFPGLAQVRSRQSQLSNSKTSKSRLNSVGKQNLNKSFDKLADYKSPFPNWLEKREDF